MDFGIYAGDTNKTIYVRLRDSTTGLAKTGLVFNSAGAVASYTLPLAARAAITLATQTVTGAHSDGGFVEVDATNCKGLYRLDLPDAAIASGDYTIISIEFDGIIEESIEIPLHIRHVNATEWNGVALATTNPLPNAAPDTSGGLPTEDASGHLAVDVREWLGTAVTTSSTTSKPQVDVDSIDDDATAADNLELMYDGTGYTDTTAPASRSQVDSIGAASGGSLNFANEADNVDSSIKSISFDGVETSGTNASANFEDGTYHQIDDTANNIDIVYQFDVGGGRSAVELTWKGRLVGTNDEFTIQAYNGSGWDTLKTITGQSNSAPTSSSDNATETIPLLLTHTGTGSDLGKVFIRMECASQSNPTLYTDLLLVAAVNIGQSIGYANGSVWLDTNASNTNTESFVDGVADNPVSTIAAAITVASAVGLKRIAIAAGSSVTLAADMTNYELMGNNWTLAFGGQTITGAKIFGATVSGTFVGTTAILEQCIIGAITGPGITMRSCYFTDVAVTANGAGDWFLNDCRSRVAGTGSFNFDFGAAVGNTGLSMRSYSGGVEIENMGGSGTDTMSLEGDGKLTINANCSGGELALRGNFAFADNASGAVTVIPTVPTIGQVDQGAAQAGSANTITLASTASATNGAYDPSHILIVSGTGAGQTRNIIDYNGTSKVAVVDRDWRTNPDTTSSYVVISDAGNLHVNEGQAQAGAATTITLNSAASATDDIYIGQSVFLVGGTGQDQTRVITDYNGTTKVATVHRAWDTNPDSTTSYVTQPLPVVGELIDNVATAVGTDGSNLTEAGGTGDQLTAIPSTVDWADGGRLDLLLDAIKVVTDALGATAAANLAKSAGNAGVVSFTVDTVTNTHTPTTTEFQADDITEATPDHYNGRIVIWLTGALAGQATDITDYAAVGGIGQFTCTALTEAPANNDTGIIV